MAGTNAFESKRRRVVITGVGVVSPIGIGADAFWRSLVVGRTGIGPLRSIPSAGLPCKLAAEIHNFDPLKYLPDRKSLKVMSRDIQFGRGLCHAGDGRCRLGPQ